MSILCVLNTRTCDSVSAFRELALNETLYKLKTETLNYKLSRRKMSKHLDTSPSGISVKYGDIIRQYDGQGDFGVAPEVRAGGKV